MRRRSAGRAGGRPGTRALLLGTVLLGAAPAALPVAPAQAAPAGDGRPVHVTVSQLEPRTVTPGAPVELFGTLVNDSEDTWTDLSVRLQRGDLITSRAGLRADVDDPGDANAAAAPFLEVPGDLEPGDSLSFTYPTTADALQLGGSGVYPLLVNVNGTRADGDAERVAELRTHLVVAPQPQSTPPPARTAVAWLWPLTDRPHRDADGAFTDDDLAGEVADGGRLDRAVDVLEQLPRVPTVEPGQSDPAVPVTLAVDPALLEELSVMAAGPYPVGDHEGAGTADAADLLQRLRAVAAEHPVAALPYADVDADSLVAADEAAVVTRSLPGTAEGTARQPGAVDGSTDGDSSSDDPGDATGAGAAVVQDVLGVQPRTDLAWPAGGTVSGPALDTLQAGGIDTVVLADSGLTDGGAAVGADGEPAAARSSLPAASGDVTVLVSDSRLTDAVGAATPDAESPRLAEQRYLAELAALTAQGNDDPATPQTVLVVPPRRVDPDPATVTAMMTDTTTEPWLAPASVEGIADGPRSDVGEPVEDTGLLPADATTDITRSSQVRDDVAAAVVDDPDTVLAGYDAALARAGSAQWRDDPDGFRASAADLRHTLAELRDQVTLLAPVDGTYTLGSSDAPLVLTVQNDLPFAVDVRLDLHTRGNVGLTTDDAGVTRLDPSSRTTLQVPTHVRQSGGFAVSARLTTPAGGPLGEAVQLQVKSTAYGVVTLAITIGAAALLGLLFLRRAVRFVLDRRRGEPGDGQQVPEGVDVLPPTRSPV